ncbi:MAG: ABC transporter permease [Chloroflexota bacterium]
MTAQLRAELLKQRSTRTVLGLFLAMLAVILVAMLLHGFGLAAEVLAPRHNQLMVLGVGEKLGVLFAALVGAVSITAEFRHGTIRPTLLAAPRRGRVVAAKLAASLLVGAGFGLAGSGLAAGVGSVLLQMRGIAIDLNGSDYALLILGGTVAGALWAAIGVGVGAVVRNQVPALIGICAWLLFVESLLVEGNSSVIEVGRFGPGAAAAAITGQGSGALLAPAVGLLVLALYAAGAGLAAWQATTRRDVA